MIGKSSVLAVIPARGGSKGLPGKNMLEFEGRPLVSWAMLSAVQSQFVDRVVLSTDDARIKETGEALGVDIPYIRPSHLANDTSPVVDTIIDLMTYMETREDRRYDLIVLLQPTSPFRTHEHVDKALLAMNSGGHESLISCKRAKHPPNWYVRRNDDATIELLAERDSTTRQRQYYEYYQFNGAVYISKWENLKSDKSFYTPPCTLFLMSEEDSIDIDSAYDFEFAKAVARCK